ncbi:hypothetical protein PN437_05855, partial [Microcystis aeruginosa CS-564/01]|uniref:glycine betaine ABC transporter substrate-binding protein n=1 Tax=Microcystis aeruginosa TaxID=1126 RepID=UPI002FEE3D96|nr:hypothetical protein [Microcystis aeruginosa CS-564/01]
MPLKRREILLGLLGASLPLVVSSCVSEKTGSSSNPSSTTATAPAATGTLPEKIRIGYQVIPNPELLAKALGLADKAFPDAKVEYISFDSGRDVNTAIAAKGIDFGALGTVPASVGIASGLPYQVYFILDVIGAAEALIVKKGIKSIADLKGKKVATPFGSTAHFSLEPTFRTLSCHREKLRREKIKVSIKINIRSEKRHLRNSKAPKMASKPI